MSIVNLNVALPYAQWRQALWQPDSDRIAQMLFHYSLLPRVAVSLLVGAGLAARGLDADALDRDFPPMDTQN